MNVKLFKEIRRHIAAEPSWLWMETWFGKYDHSTCGTTGCIAGWAVALQEMNKDKSFKEVVAGLFGSAPADRAAKLLEIDDTQANRLFFVNEWPDEFRGRYREAREKLHGAFVNYRMPTTERLDKVKEAQCELAHTTADRIQFFIDTNGTDQITSK